MSVLKNYSVQNNNGYIFSLTAGKLPVHAETMRRSLFNALKNMKIDDNERRERNICFHSWRHYLNTTMRSNNILDGKLRAMVGHSSSKMTEHYTHFSTDDFSDIQEVQKKIINFTNVG